ncbi:hypothetical protein M141_2808 [Bacteroides fragilis str. S38L5]|nr:hypothetical protein M141_2808 [Bacteroides fragilis str. S38L5]EYB13838.1 hypothetical protein M140_2752 [Bacteroides fragilis str. S38L3]
MPVSFAASPLLPVILERDCRQPFAQRGELHIENRTDAARFRRAVAPQLRDDPAAAFNLYPAFERQHHIEQAHALRVVRKDETRVAAATAGAQDARTGKLPERRGQRTHVHPVMLRNLGGGKPDPFIIAPDQVAAGNQPIAGRVQKHSPFTLLYIVVIPNIH